MDSPPNLEKSADAVSLFRAMPGAEPRAMVAPVGADISPVKDVAALQARLIAAGVRPNRLTCPDLIGQLEQANSIKIDTLICSVLDTDPTVGLNAAIAESFREELAAGVGVLAKVSGAERVWIAADPDQSADWFDSVKASLELPNLRLIPLRGDYPQTDPTLMLFTLLQRRLVPGKLPSSKGVLLVDAAAAVGIGRALLTESPVRETPLAVRDHFQRRTHLLSAPMGVRLAEVLEFLELRNTDAVFRAGDFLRDLWITPNTMLGNGELIIHPTASHLDANPDPCIHCGWCLEACPTRIHPAGLLDAAQQGSTRLAKRFGIDACIECGICSYVCPTRLPLLTAIRGLRKI